MNQPTDYHERYSAGWSQDSIRLFHVASSFAKSSYFYVQECGYFQTNDTYFTERENLNSYLLVYTLSGKGKLLYLGKEYTLNAGDCFYINCLEKHHYQTEPGHNWELLWIHFNGPVALGYYEKFTENGFQIIHVQDNFFMERSFHRVIALNKKRMISSELLTSNVITSILTELTIQSMTNNATYILIPDTIKQVIFDIEHNFKSDISLQSLATKHNLNKFHLAKEFKKYTGTTVVEYIITNRLAYAKELLKYSDLSISEITFKIGMNNISHFINLFKTRENMTPLAFRKQWK